MSTSKKSYRFPFAAVRRSVMRFGSHKQRAANILKFIDHVKNECSLLSLSGGVPF
jgi:hypothetical protein